MKVTWRLRLAMWWSLRDPAERLGVSILLMILLSGSLALAIDLYWSDEARKYGSVFMAVSPFLWWFLRK